MRRLQALTEKACALFQKRFGSSPTLLSRAPCRVNVIGEHTDYTGGYCLPFAGDRYVVIAGRGVPRKSVQLFSEQEGQITVSWQKERQTRGDWGDYVRGILLSLPFPFSKGVAGVIASEIPLGAGLSSSAALCVALLNLFLRLSGQRLSWLERAQICQKAEHIGKGVPCGILDMLTILRGRTQHALWIDCQTLQAQAVPLQLPSSLKFAAIQTGISRALAASAYKDRVQEAAAAAQQLQQKKKNFSYRKDLMFVQKAKRFLPSRLYRRALHIASENDRVVKTVQALKRHKFTEVGKLMNASHWSLSRNYEVSLPIIDQVVKELQRMPGVLGARLMGAGFGGSLLALINREALPSCERWLMKQNEAEPSLSLSCCMLEAVPGARVVSLPSCLS